MLKKIIFTALLITGATVQCGAIAEYNSWQAENRDTARQALVALKKHLAKFGATYAAGTASALLLLASYVCEPTYTPQELQIKNEFWRRPEIGDLARESKDGWDWNAKVLALAKGTAYETIRNRNSKIFYARTGLFVGGVLCLGYALAAALESMADCPQPVSNDYTDTQE